MQHTQARRKPHTAASTTYARSPEHDLWLCEGLGSICPVGDQATEVPIAAVLHHYVQRALLQADEASMCQSTQAAACCNCLHCYCCFGMFDWLILVAVLPADAQPMAHC
jgi:hypothetical protein